MQFGIGEEGTDMWLFFGLWIFSSGVAIWLALELCEARKLLSMWREQALLADQQNRLSKRHEVFLNPRLTSYIN